jgi:hypothetical protein
LDKAREQLEPFLDDLANGDSEAKKDIQGIIAVMHIRKQSLYAHDSRFIVDYSLTENDDSLSLQVASTPMGSRKPDLSSSPKSLTANS